MTTEELEKVLADISSLPDDELIVLIEEARRGPIPPDCPFFSGILDSHVPVAMAEILRKARSNQPFRSSEEAYAQMERMKGARNSY